MAQPFRQLTGKFRDVLRGEGLVYASSMLPVWASRCLLNLIRSNGLLNAISRVPAARVAFHQTAETRKKQLK
jgi:hypothetical protein